MAQHLVELKVWGRYGCFTRPESKVERVSYPIITPSAARGVLDAIYWKPQFRWQITEILVLPHPELPSGQAPWQNYMSATLNELAQDGQEHPDEYHIEENGKAKHRVQRTCLILRWPCYIIRARAQIFCSTTNPAAIKRQFDDRVSRGQCFQQPCFGLRQFTAYFCPVGPDDEPIRTINGNFGLITYAAVHRQGADRVDYRFVPCEISEGRFQVDTPEVPQ